MPLSESLEAQTRREVASIVCPSCQHEKTSGSPLCSECWRALPEGLRSDLQQAPFCLDRNASALLANHYYAVLLEEVKEHLARLKA
jgi:predicted amidophosphoribosyltransferase